MMEMIGELEKVQNVVLKAKNIVRFWNVQHWAG